ncbi:hypothetical protein C8R43DRAFT_1078116 [Mycena crocata]|nr:hypothetical protein C8R43DRAFT_1078116 [Mycena crocata]
MSEPSGTGNSSAPAIKLVRPYKRKTVLPVPIIPTPPADANAYSATPSGSATIHAPVNLQADDFPHQQPRIRVPKLSAEARAAAELAAKFTAMDEFLQKLEPFTSLGDFLSILFFNRPHAKSDPRGTTHAKSVSRFLSGNSDIRMSHILPLMYKHRSSFPSINSLRSEERNNMFSTSGHPDDIRFARPFLSTWAARLTAVEARKQVAAGTRNDPDDPEDNVQLRAKTNGRGKGRVITPRDLENFSIRRIEEKYLKKLPLPMMLIEFMSAPSAKGVFIVRERRPYPMIQVAALSSFIVSRNRYANGDLAMVLGVWHFACKSHIDVKRVYCRLGGSVSDTTARDVLASITEAAFAELREKVQDATERGETEHCTLVDNIQQHVPVYEQGIGRVSELMVGTGATHVGLQDCAPKAFDAEDYYGRVAQKRRKELTVFSLYADIDWIHINGHRMRDGRITPFQPLSSNSERETSTQGMDRASEDFDVQVGIDPKVDSGLLSWIRGDGSSYDAILRLTRYCASLEDKFNNKISTPEIWHTGATDLNSMAENHSNEESYEPERDAEVLSPLIDQMNLVDNSEQKARAEDSPFRNFAPFLVPQMLWVDADYLPFSTLFDLRRQIHASTPSSCNGFTAISNR